MTVKLDYTWSIFGVTPKNVWRKLKRSFSTPLWSFVSSRSVYSDSTPIDFVRRTFFQAKRRQRWLGNNACNCYYWTEVFVLECIVIFQSLFSCDRETEKEQWRKNEKTTRTHCLLSNMTLIYEFHHQQKWKLYLLCKLKSDMTWWVSELEFDLIFENNGGVGMEWDCFLFNGVGVAYCRSCSCLNHR